MNVHIPRQLVTGAALAGTLAFVAACSGPSSSLNPTSPSATASAAAGASFSPNCGEDCPPPTCDPKVTDCTPLQGRFTGGGFQISGNVKVTRGFTLHCDAILSNNFEVNWAGGNNFHIDKNPTNVRCSYVGDPTPPVADVNRIEIIGSGKLNGVSGARIHLVLIDNGEPGTQDQAFIEIGPVTAPILSVGGSASSPSTIAGGNIQAHIDQPHKPR